MMCVVAGMKGRPNSAPKTTKNIADCDVGRECNEDTRKSVNDGIEVNLTDPPEPQGDVTTHKTKKHKRCLA